MGKDIEKLNKLKKSIGIDGVYMDKLREDVRKDHDRIIRMETKLDSICHNLQDHIKTSQDDHKELIQKIDRNYDRVDEKFIVESHHCDACKTSVNNEIKTKVGLNLMMWIVGGIFGVILTLSLIFGGIALDNQRTVSAIEHELEDHIAYAVYIYETITGTKWGTASREDINSARERYKEVRRKAEEIEHGKEDK